MAMRFGQGLIQSLINPSYGQGLFQAGQSAGQLAAGVPQQARAAQEQQRLREQQQQAGLLSAYQMGTDPGGSNPAAAMAAIAQGTGASAPDLVSMMEAGRGQRAAVKESDTEAAKRRALSQYLTAQNRNDLAGLAEQGVVTSANYKDFMNKPVSEVASMSFNNVGTFKDEEGNYYQGTTTRNPSTGAVQNVLSPITPGAPAQPTGRVIPVGGAYSETASERSERETEEAGGKAEAKTYGEMRVQAVNSVGDLYSSVQNIDRALELVDQVPTGNPINTAATALEAFLGETSADKAELQVLLGNEMYKRLKPLFGGVISEGERDAIKKIYAGLEKGNPANKGILRQMRADLERAYQKAKIAQRADTFEEYNELVSKMYPEDNTGPRKVNWNSLNSPE